MPAALEHFRIEELEALFESWGCKPSHAARLVRVYYATGSFPSQSVLELPVALRERLNDSATGSATSVAHREVSSDGTTKLLLRLHDDAEPEGGGESEAEPVQDQGRGQGAEELLTVSRTRAAHLVRE